MSTSDRDPAVSAFIDQVTDSPTIDKDVADAVQQGTLTDDQADQVVSDGTIVIRRAVQRM